jgi:hypothetical protein
MPATAQESPGLGLDRPAIFDGRIPLEGIGVLKAALPEGRMIPSGSGAVLSFEGSSEWKVAGDLRLFVHTSPEEWQDPSRASLAG